jgi:hypothetical protein
MDSIVVQPPQPEAIARTKPASPILCANNRRADTFGFLTSLV